MVLSAVEAEQLFVDAVPDGAGGYTLKYQADALRHDEPRVPQHNADQVVAEHLGTVWAQRDRPLALRLGEHLTHFVGLSVEPVGEGR
jgi:hypothetical protein